MNTNGLLTIDWGHDFLVWENVFVYHAFDVCGLGEGYYPPLLGYLKSHNKFGQTQSLDRKLGGKFGDEFPNGWQVPHNAEIVHMQSNDGLT